MKFQNIQPSTLVESDKEAGEEAMGLIMKIKYEAQQNQKLVKALKTI